MTKDIFDDVSRKPVVYLDRFTVGLDDLTEEQQGDKAEVLRVIEKAKLFSVFEATENMVIANMLTDLEKTGMITSERIGFPWIKAEITEKAKAFLAEQQPKENKDDAS